MQDRLTALDIVELTNLVQREQRARINSKISWDDRMAERKSELYAILDQQRKIEEDPCPKEDFEDAYKELLQEHETLESWMQKYCDALHARNPSDGFTMLAGQVARFADIKKYGNDTAKQNRILEEKLQRANVVLDERRKAMEEVALAFGVTYDTITEFHEGMTAAAIDAVTNEQVIKDYCEDIDKIRKLLTIESDGSVFPSVKSMADYGMSEKKRANDLWKENKKLKEQCRKVCTDCRETKVARQLSDLNTRQSQELTKQRQKIENLQDRLKTILTCAEELAASQQGE